MNDLGNVITEYCDKNIDGFIYHRDIYNLYIENGGTTISSKGFTSMMKEKGYIQYKRNDGRGFKGLNLKITDNDII